MTQTFKSAKARALRRNTSVTGQLSRLPAAVSAAVLRARPAIEAFLARRATRAQLTALDDRLLKDLDLDRREIETVLACRWRGQTQQEPSCKALDALLPGSRIWERRMQPWMSFVKDGGGYEHRT